MTAPATASPTIAELFAVFLDEQEARLAPRTFANYRSIIELFADCLNGYGHQYLSEFDAKRWEAAYSGGDEDAFVNLFGADKIMVSLDEFLGYFMIRKVMASEEHDRPGTARQQSPQRSRGRLGDRAWRFHRHGAPPRSSRTRSA